MDLSHAILFGIIQGVTEFLPISSSAHLRIIRNICGIFENEPAFEIFLNAGSFLAIVFFYHQLIWKLLRGSWDLLTVCRSEDRDFFITIAVSSVPVIVIFGIAEIVFSISINSMLIMSIAMIVFSVVLWLCDRNAQQMPGPVSRKHSILVGIAQILSFIPGVSRLGSCLSMMRYLGYSRRESFRYAMLMSLVPVCGAITLKLLKVFCGKIFINDWNAVFVGGLFAFVSGLITLHFMDSFLKTHQLLPIIIYRIIFGFCIAINCLF
ncbi:MAG: undecaprenyl-diphosphate phosphatase [Holosporaceae bacterium]|jgi:undecaprenyl-diphosphatase|nr:undecaprenyl-diphosphate phosphatase [Holosporaceae bacterium]